MNNKIFFIIFMLIMVSCPVYALSFQDATNFFSSFFNSIASFFKSAFSVLTPSPTGGGGGGGGGSPSGSSGGGTTLCSSSLSLSISGKDTCTVTATATSTDCINRTYEIKDGGSKCSGTITVSSFTKTCTWTVMSGAYTYGLYIDGEYKLSKSVSCSKTPPPTCSDGTLYGQCSSTKPKYCDNGNLIDKCSQCGCPSGKSCNSTTNTCYTPVQTCSDGTLYGQCSSNKPKYCSSGTLVDKCSQCGCPTGQPCNSTTNDCYTPVMCACDTWTSGACGGSCSSGQRQQIRTCTPTGCTPTDGLGLSKCVADSTCNSPAQFQVTIDSSKVLGTNNFSIGFMTDWSWPTFVSDNARRQLVKDANFKLVRVFDFRTTSPKIMPCSNWDTTKDNCTSWDWTQVDSFTQAVFEMGAEPMFTLGWPDTDTTLTLSRIPPGMQLNSTTGLPNSNSYAVYAAEWVKHFKQKGWPVRYYEIMNEPFAYFGWNPSPSNNLKLTYYVDFWNTVARAMRQQNPNILLSQDAVTETNVLNYWLLHGDDVDYLDFHKYDCGVWDKSDPAYYSDSKLFSLAESSHFESVGSFYGLKESQQKWLASRGKLLPVIESEGNLNSAWQGGTDPRIQQMTGAVWTALELRQGILKGLQYNVYYEFSSSSNSNRISGGYGFGMIDSYNNKPWYPYYVQKWIGNNLDLGDNLVQSTSSSGNIRTLSWINNGKLNILLIHNSTATETVSLNGITGQLTYQKIDDPTGTSYLNAQVQTGTIDASIPITLNGYTVMFLQKI